MITDISKETIDAYTKRLAKDVLFVSSLGKYVEQARIEQLVQMKKGLEEYSKKELIEACLGSYIRIEELQKEVETLEKRIKEKSDDAETLDQIKKLLGCYDDDWCD